MTAVTRRRPVRATAALTAVATLALGLAGCGSTRPSGAATTTTPSTSGASATSSTTVAPAPTVPGSSVDGPKTGELPPVPTAPSSPPSLPAPTSSAFLHAAFNDVQSLWQREFATAALPYRPAQLVIFHSTVRTACGVESAQTGPFYCSGDRTVYLDTQFFTALSRAFGVGGDFAEAYIVAHEVGHHVQNLLGITGRVAAADQADPAGKNARSVAVELQADCFAGVWAHSTYERKLLAPGDLQKALQAAQVVGDDFLARASGQLANPDGFTHGTSAQRQHWLSVGYDSGLPQSCNTFGG